MRKQRPLNKLKGISYLVRKTRNWYQHLKWKQSNIRKKKEPYVLKLKYQRGDWGYRFCSHMGIQIDIANGNKREQRYRQE